MGRHINTKSFNSFSSLVCVLALVLLGFSVSSSEAQQVAPPAQAVITPTLQIEVPPAQVRTWEEITAAAALEAAGPPPRRRKKPFHTTVADVTYQDLKGKAAKNQRRQASPAPGTAAPAQLTPAVLSNPINFAGVDAVTAGNWYPPDTHGAVGLNHFVEITNSHLDIYLKAAPNNRVVSVSLSAFFGYTTQALFDVRVIYDPTSDPNNGRWIISADAFRESNTVQKFFFAVSQTNDPTGDFYIYNVNVSTGKRTLWDFPQLGMDQNALIFTANFFNANSFVDARMFAVAKSLVYHGQSFTLNLFKGLAGSLAPPIVLDANANTFLVAAAPADNKVTLYTLTNSGTSPSLSPASTIPVPAYSPPPNAPQPGTTALIDTSDSRFVNVSTQIGNSLFQVHTIDIDGFARPRVYEFDTVNMVVLQSATFARSSTSYDFNASLAANRKKDVFVTWSATDPINSVNVEVRFSGCLHNDPLNVISGPGSLLYGSTSNLTGDRASQTDTTQRWGDYSAVSLDPSDSTGATAWIVNETILDTNTWGSRIGQIKAQLKDSLPAILYLLLLDQP